MSSSNYGPYQSRLLKFISKQSRQIAENCDRTWRQVKSATLNTTQILLYPAYLLVQSSRMLARQLRESSQKIDLPELQEFAERENLKFSQNSSPNWWDEEIGAESAIVDIVHMAENILLPSQTRTKSENLSFVITAENLPAPVTPQALGTQTHFTRNLAKTPRNLVLEHQDTETPLTEISINNGAAVNTTPKVRGIATFLPARSLVLVGAENQILDILTQEQQELLEGRITWEVANSGPGRREIAKKELKFNLGLEEAAAKSLLPPVRGFWQLMAWVQTSPLALKRNQFGESILAMKKAINASADRHLIIAQTDRAPITGVKIDRPAITSASAIDYHTSELTTDFYSKFDRATNPLSFVTLLDRAAVNLEEFTIPQVSKITGDLTDRQPAQIEPTTEKLSPSTRSIVENYAKSIEQMIWSSVDYLLGKETAASDNTEKSLAIKYSLQQKSVENTEKTETKGDRPWLNWQDLFGEPAPPAPEKITQISTKVKPENTEIEKLPPGRSTPKSPSPYPEAIQNLLAQLKSSINIKVTKSQPQKTSNLENTQKNSRQSNLEASTQIQTQKTQPETATTPEFGATASKYISITKETEKKNPEEQAQECLETTAESMGYIKHPLEQVLEWLDRIMVRLETIVEQLWEWAKIHFPKIINSKD
ncbi:hypothetical protein [Microcoleus sp. EPA2]|uniref:hypothetical protein n=1 Tax=Microcoleus sp. EPA2 TaxID=2841654 RepID=UPI00312B3832